jgi:hypothetical protein
MIPLRTGPAPLLLVFLVACAAAACGKQPDPPPAEPPAASATASSAPSSTPEASATPDAASADASNGTDAATDPKDAASAQASASAAPTGKAPTPAPSASGPKAYTCGTKPQPDCPLQGWMKANANAPMAAADTPALGDVFDNIVKFAPPGYSNWASISRDGAKAARLGKLDGAKAACRACHDQYKAKYRLAFRDRKI